MKNQDREMGLVLARRRVEILKSKFQGKSLALFHHDQNLLELTGARRSLAQEKLLLEIMVLTTQQV
jgi:hypothetical protein